MLDAKAGKQRLRFLLGPAATDESERPPRLAAEQQVFRDRHPRQQGKFLEHRAHAVSMSVLRPRERDWLSLDLDHARIRSQPPAQGLDQGAFARAVLADKRVHFTERGRERSANQRLHSPERLADIDTTERDATVYAERTRSLERQSRPNIQRRLKSLGRPS